VYVSEDYDIAVLSVPRINDLTAASINSLDLEDWVIGSEVVYTGYPSSYSRLTSTGFVSGTAINYSGSVLVQGFVWPGSSGAGVFDSNGKLVGLVWALGVESFAGRPQALETLVYVCPLNREEVEKIKNTLKSL
jgi:S1-C subfamily serine protease